MSSKATPIQEAPLRFGREEPYDFSCLHELLEADYAPPRGRTIHLGCGNGRTSLFVTRQRFRVLGIDPDRDLLAAARERAAMAGLDLDLMAGDPLALPPLPEESFALAIDLRTAGSLEPGLEREEYLRRILRLLMRNGVLIASAPPPKRRRNARKRHLFAFADPFVSDFTRAGFEVMFEGIRTAPAGDRRLFVHARKPG